MNPLTSSPRRSARWAAAALVATWGAASTAQAQTLYVDANLTTGAGDGSSWSDAFQGPLGVQMALAAATAGDDIWVAEGTYKPADSMGSRAVSIDLQNDVGLYGGFTGGESSLAERPPFQAHPSVLSGDLMGDDLPGGGNRFENSFHVVNTTGTNSTAILDGFEITAGNANGSGNGDVGGGILCFGSMSPTVRNCLFRDNRCTFGGGAGYINGASPTFTGCTFENNDGGSFGGAFDIATGGLIRFDRCVFRGNSAQRAGALEIFATGQVRVTNCLFENNTATGSSGGGGIWIGSGGSSRIQNCTIVNNSATFSVGGGIRVQGATPSIRNSIIWNNTGPSGAQALVNQVQGTTDIEYSIVEGDTGGMNGNLGVDPMFVDPMLGEYDLAAGSPAIDAGDSDALTQGTGNDILGRRRYVDDPMTADTGVGGAPIIDIGAFEFPAGALGIVYCDTPANSSGEVGEITARGSLDVTLNDFSLTATNLPMNQFGIFLGSRTEGFTPNPGGSSGNLCLGGAIGRFVGPGQIVHSGANGSFSISVDLNALPTPSNLVPAMSGETWSFQAWYRDMVFIAPTSNYTDATTVAFQ